MNSTNFRRLVTAATAAVVVLVAVPALAQAPAGGPPPGGGMGMGMGMGMGGPVDRPSMIKRLALDDPALKLSADQQKQLDKIVDGYVADQAKLREKYPMTPGGPPNQEMMTAMRGAREGLNAAVGKVLNDSQRATWEAAMAARRPQGMGPGMGPGMGGQMGGPPPTR